MRSRFTRHLHNRQCRSTRVAQHNNCAPKLSLRVAAVASLACHLHGFTCALVPRATIAAPRRPPLAVSCTCIAGLILMVGCAAVTTITMGCTQCAAGTWQGLDSHQIQECVPCFTGSYAAGASPLPHPAPNWSQVRRRSQPSPTIGLNIATSCT